MARINGEQHCLRPLLNRNVLKRDVQIGLNGVWTIWYFLQIGPHFLPVILAPIFLVHSVCKIEQKDWVPG